MDISRVTDNKDGDVLNMSFKKKGVNQNNYKLHHQQSQAETSNDPAARMLLEDFSKMKLSAFDKADDEIVHLNSDTPQHQSLQASHLSKLKSDIMKKRDDTKTICLKDDQQASKTNVYTEAKFKLLSDSAYDGRKQKKEHDIANLSQCIIENRILEYVAEEVTKYLYIRTRSDKPFVFESIRKQVVDVLSEYYNEERKFLTVQHMTLFLKNKTANDKNCDYCVRAAQMEICGKLTHSSVTHFNKKHAILQPYYFCKGPKCSFYSVYPFVFKQHVIKCCPANVLHEWNGKSMKLLDCFRDYIQDGWKHSLNLTTLTLEKPRPASEIPRSLRTANVETMTLPVVTTHVSSSSRKRSMNVRRGSLRKQDYPINHSPTISKLPVVLSNHAVKQQKQEHASNAANPQPHKKARTCSNSSRGEGIITFRQPDHHHFAQLSGSTQTTNEHQIIRQEPNSEPTRTTTFTSTPITQKPKNYQRSQVKTTTGQDFSSKHPNPKEVCNQSRNNSYYWCKTTDESDQTKLSDNATRTKRGFDEIEDNNEKMLSSVECSSALTNGLMIMTKEKALISTKASKTNANCKRLKRTK